MNSISSDYYFTRGEVLIILILIGGIAAAVYWALWRRWRNRLKTLEQELADARAKYDSEYFQALHDHLHSAVAHDFVHDLDDISNKSMQTLEGLGEEQTFLRQKQLRIIEKTYDSTQHAENILVLFASERDTPQMELLSVRQSVERVLLGFFSFAESRGVVLMPNLEDLEPTTLDRNWTLVALKNVIHNAIKYSHRGGVVEIVLFLKNPEEAAGKTICVEVKDTGKGIQEESQDKIFELRKRGDGLIEPGSGLGLYCAREAARRQGGDVILVHSSLNQGSVFRIILPYRTV
jgi:signal transduction histidine kinase